MSYSYNPKSQEKLATCHPDLQRLFNEAIKHVDITIVEGVRTKDRQEELVHAGMSKTLNSKHLAQKDGYSHAVDAVPCPIDWENTKRNYLFAGFIKGLAAAMNIKIRIGADWDGDFDTKDQTFNDTPHFELVIEE